MIIEFDDEKSRYNVTSRDLPFSRVIEFDWSTAKVMEDTRFNYPEKRYVATGLIGDRAHVVCFTPIQDGIRVISFRKANKREVKYYES